MTTKRTKQPQQILSESSHAKHNNYQPENQLEKNFTTDLQGATQSRRKQLKMQPTPKKSKETYSQNRNAHNMHSTIAISSLTFCSPCCFLSLVFPFESSIIELT